MRRCILSPLIVPPLITLSLLSLLSPVLPFFLSELCFVLHVCSLLLTHAILSCFLNPLSIVFLYTLLYSISLCIFLSSLLSLPFFHPSLSLSLSPTRTPLHCAASCNNVQVCKFLVESGAAVFAVTHSDMQTAADKCEEMEEGYAQCSQFLYGQCVCVCI